MTNKSKSDTKKLIVQIIEMLPAKYRKMVIVSIPVVLLVFGVIRFGCDQGMIEDRNLCRGAEAFEEVVRDVEGDVSELEMPDMPDMPDIGQNP